MATKKQKQKEQDKIVSLIYLVLLLVIFAGLVDLGRMALEEDNYDLDPVSVIPESSEIYVATLDPVNGLEQSVKVYFYGNGDFVMTSEQMGEDMVDVKLGKWSSRSGELVDVDLNEVSNNDTVSDITFYKNGKYAEMIIYPTSLFSEEEIQFYKE